MYWGEMKGPEIGVLDKDLIVVIPTASCEQHGQHLPVLTDTLLVSEVVRRVEARLSRQVVVLPTLWLGSSGHHGDFPGTLSLSAALYTEVVTSLAQDLLRTGFRRLFFLLGHGGNEIPTAQALADLSVSSELASQAFLATATYWQVAKQAMAPERHGMTQPALAHACEYETSMTLVARPDLVDMTRATAGPPAHADRWWHSELGGPVQVFARFGRITATGAMGLPQEATREKGESLLAAITEEMVAFLQDFAAWPELRPR
jgi:creatinine amidohydrolase